MDAAFESVFKSVCTEVTEIINAAQLGDNTVHLATVRKVLGAIRTGSKLTGNVNVVELAAKGDRRARSALKEKVYQIIASKKYLEKDIDRLLEGYYINYYGTPADISSTTTDLLVDKLNQILIPRDSQLTDKYRKFAQMVFQECFGYGILDEFMDLGIDDKLHKVEEIAISGENQLSLKISGLNFKLDKLTYPDVLIRRVTGILATKSERSLSKVNDLIESELLDGSRITLTCPPRSKYYTYNLRLHYHKSVSIEQKIKLGSTTAEFEKWLDAAMNCKSRIVVGGPQASGKSTDIYQLCERYQPNTTVVTAESAYELNLENIRHLTVVPLKLASDDDIDEFLASLFRYNAQALVLGEARTGNDAYLYTQISKRQSYGTICSWHTSNAKDCLFDMARNLMTCGKTRSLEEALIELSNSIDFIIVKDIADEFSLDPGLRHVKEVCEVPKIDRETFTQNKGIELKTIFKFDYGEDFTLKRVEDISDDMANKLEERCHRYSEIKRLRI